MTDIIGELEALIAERKNAGDTATSYTARLLADPQLLAAKITEEAGELVDEIGKDKKAITHESADLFYHLLVLLGANNISWDDVATALEKRRGVSGLEEKQSRTNK